MKMNRRYVSADSVWVASDRHGVLGVFDSRGSGPIPTVVIDATADKDCDAHAALLDLPVVGKANHLSMDWDPVYTQLAERGLFVFDWMTPGHGGDQYWLVAIPERPITWADLSPEVAAIVVELSFPNAEYGSERYLTSTGDVEFADAYSAM